MKNFIESGKNITVILAAIATPGIGLLVGGMFGVTTNGGAIGDACVVQLEGVFTLPKAAGALALGLKIYWDDTAKNITATSTSNTFVGYVWLAALTGDATVQIRLQTA